MRLTATATAAVLGWTATRAPALRARPAANRGHGRGARPARWVPRVAAPHRCVVRGAARIARERIDWPPPERARRRLVPAMSLIGAFALGIAVGVSLEALVVSPELGGGIRPPTRSPDESTKAREEVRDGTCTGERRCPA